MAKVVVATPDVAKKKWEENLAKAAPKLVRRATSPEATEAYKRNLAKFLGLTPEQISDEAEKRNASLSRLTPEAFLEAIKGKGTKWYEEMKAAFAD